MTAFIGHFLSVINLLKPQVFALVVGTYRQPAAIPTHPSVLMNPSKGKAAIMIRGRCQRHSINHTVQYIHTYSHNVMSSCTPICM